MICTIRRVWAGSRVTTIIATDAETQREVRCFVYMTTKGALIASLCERAEMNGRGVKPPVVLTMKPATDRWGHELEAAELMIDQPQPRTVPHDAHLGATE